MSLLRALGRYVGARRSGCELCGAPIEPEHAHIAETDTRRLVCACRACAILFTVKGKRRTVPDRFVSDRSFSFTDAEWASLAIPVSIAFFFRSTAAGRFVAVYPSAAGAVESLLPLEQLAEVLARSEVLSTLEPDVEAVLASDHGARCFVVPIDACYAMIGALRHTPRGLSGARDAIDEQVARIEQRCSP